MRSQLDLPNRQRQSILCDGAQKSGVDVIMRDWPFTRAKGRVLCRLKASPGEGIATPRCILEVREYVKRQEAQRGTQGSAAARSLILADFELGVLRTYAALH